MNKLTKTAGLRLFIIYLGIVLPVLFFGSTATGEGGYEYSEYRTGNADAPIIEHVLAADDISPGTTWRLYLWASDPNGDISKVFYKVYQPGLENYDPGYMRVKPGADGKLQGYIYMNTVSMARSAGWQMYYTVKVNVVDAAGNHSLPKQFKVNFNGNRQADVRNWESAKLASMGSSMPPRLGRINVDLIPCAVELEGRRLRVSVTSDSAENCQRI